jgi:hypothetical protein
VAFRALKRNLKNKKNRVTYHKSYVDYEKNILLGVSNVTGGLWSQQTEFEKY